MAFYFIVILHLLVLCGNFVLDFVNLWIPIDCKISQLVTIFLRVVMLNVWDFHLIIFASY